MFLKSPTTLCEGSEGADRASHLLCTEVGLRLAAFKRRVNARVKLVQPRVQCSTLGVAPELPVQVSASYFYAKDSAGQLRPASKHLDPLLRRVQCSTLGVAPQLSVQVSAFDIYAKAFDIYAKDSAGQLRPASKHLAFSVPIRRALRPKVGAPCEWARKKTLSFLHNFTHSSRAIQNKSTPPQ